MTNADTHLLVEALQAVKTCAEAGDALVLGPGAVHNLWAAIQALTSATNPVDALDRYVRAMAKQLGTEVDETALALARAVCEQLVCAACGRN